MRGSPRTGMVAVVGLGALALAGCAPASPIVLGNADVVSCVDATQRHQILSGVPLQNHGTTSVTISGVDYEDIQNGSVAGSWIIDAVPTDDGGTLSFGTVDYPPSEDELNWGARIDAVGATIASGRQTTLVLLLRQDDPSEGSYFTRLVVQTDAGDAVSPADLGFSTDFATEGGCHVE